MESNKIKYKHIENSEDLIDLINLIETNKINIIGLDCEFYRGDEYEGSLCTIQFSFIIELKIEVFILDLLKIEKITLESNLNRILSDRNIEFVIHACENDLNWIYDYLNIEIKNIFDTQDAYKYLYNSRIGLNQLIKKYFNINFDDNTKKHFQKSNWKLRPLKKEQLDYAALDVYYLIDLKFILVQEMLSKSENTFNIYKKKFEKSISKIKNSQKKNEFNERNALKYLLSNITNFNLETIDEVKFTYLEIFRKNDELAKRKNVNREKLLSEKIIYKIVKNLPLSKEQLQFILIPTNIDNLLTNDEYFIFTEQIYSIVLNSSKIIEEENISLKNNHKIDIIKEKIIKKENIIKKFSCKKPIYENCLMQAPDGELLSYCDNKKMNWYINKNLAEIICKEPPIFRLLFEPNSRGCKDGENNPSNFYVSSRKNCCVICGNEENYMRFHVVPVLYRQYLPNELKSHKSHDVVLLCFPCNEQANKIYDIKKKTISSIYNVPLNIISNKQIENLELRKIVGIAKLLHNNYEVMPIDKRDKFVNQIKNYIEKNKINNCCNLFFNHIFDLKNVNIENLELSKDVLNKIKNIKLKFHSQKDKKNSHGKLVIDKISDNTSFIKEWRIFFIESFKPKYLPDSWNVEHEFYRTFGEHSKFNKNK